MTTTPAAYDFTQASIITNEISADLFESFISYLDVTEKSISTYKIGLRQLAKYFTENAITHPTRADLLKWREELLQSGHKASTIQLYITTAKLFFQWTEQEEIYPDISKHLKGAKVDNTTHKKDYFTAAQISEMLEGMETDTIKGKRDKAIFLLMVTAGLRTIEVSRANVEDLDTVGGYRVLYVQGKGRQDKADFIKISPKTDKAIRDYLTARKAKDGEALFTSAATNHTGERIATGSISRLVKTTFRANGYDSDRLTAHSLRHTAVTLSLLAGNDITEVQQFARHKNIATTMIYNHSLNKLANGCSNSIDNML